VSHQSITDVGAYDAFVHFDFAEPLRGMKIFARGSSDEASEVYTDGKGVA